jgi:prepilin-type N-terminal cleavage/methylation domain-containing protein
MKRFMSTSQKTRPGEFHRARGFSLIETLIAVAIVTAVIAVVVQGITKMQRRSFVEGSKIDTVQETRDFIDQMVRDVHNVGYPAPKVNPSFGVDCTKPATDNLNVACGLIYFSPTQIRYEADLDGSGTVYQVWVQVVAGANGKCPCILQRGAISKAQVLLGTNPTYFTEVNGVLNSGDGSGNATFAISLPGSGSYTTYGTADVFSSYDSNATLNPVGTCATAAACSSIRSLQITANVVPSFIDNATNTFQVTSITSKVRLNNVAIGI